VEEDDAKVDFHLVATYLPIISLMLRGCVAILILESSQFLFAGTSSVVCVAVALAYWDLYLFHTCPLSRICGGIAIPLLMEISGRLLISSTMQVTGTNNTFVLSMAPVIDTYFQQHCVGVEALIMTWSFDIIWAVSSSFYLSCLVYEAKYTSKYFPILWTLCCILKVWSLCDRMVFYELFPRTLLYYVSSAVFFYSNRYLLNVDRNIHRMITPHICYHFLFVQVYITIASLVVFSALFMQIFTNKNRQEVYTLPITKPIVTRQGEKNKEGSVGDLALLEQLKRAKGSGV